MPPSDNLLSSLLLISLALYILQGIGLTCNYFVDCTHNVHILDSAQEVVAGLDIPISMNSSLDKLFR